MWNSLAQTLIKITAPGVPDFYQGTELWNLSLVDPDNRRPVDLRAPAGAARRNCQLRDDDPRRAARARTGTHVDDLVTSRADGRIKLYVTAAALRARRADPDLYLRGDYVPLPVAGTRAAHVFAFARAFGTGRAVVAIVPRLTATLLPDAATRPIGRERLGATRA